MSVRILPAMCVLWFVHFGFTGCASHTITPTESDSGVINFVDTKHGMSFTYPGDWKENKFFKPRNVIILLQPRAGERAGTLPQTVSVIAQESKPSAPPDLDRMEARMIEKAQKEIGEFQLIEQSDAMVAGEPARRVIYSGKKLGVRLQVMNILTTHASQAYAVAYMSDPATFDAARPTVDKLVASIEFTR